MTATISPPLQHEPRRTQGGTSFPRLLVVALITIACLSCAVQAKAASHKGLPLASSVPSWASKKSIHFFPSRPIRSRGSKEPHPFLGLRCEETYCPKPPLLYKGGAGVQHSPKLYVIFWGSKWNESTGTAVRAQLLKMYEGLSKSAYQGILTQYFDATGRISSSVTVTSYTDTSVTAPSSVNDVKVKEEVASAIKAKGWTREFNAQFVVIPAPGTTYEKKFTEGGFCAYHEVDTSGSSYTFAPYVGDEPFFVKCAGYDAGLNAGNVTSMLASHEYAESATDPNPSKGTWQDSEGYELADLCISGDDQLSSGVWVQGLWDDNQSACSLSDLEPPHVYAITGSSANVTSNSATLKGTINPEALESTYHFEYGPSTAYGTSAPLPSENAGSGATNIDESRVVGGLQPATLYHYRIVAANSTGTTNGEDRTFSTPPSSSWSVSTTPNPAEAKSTQFTGTACPAVFECISVGYYEQKSTGTAFQVAELWNGKTWSIQKSPTPSGSVSSFLSGISCSAKATCTAVGAYLNSSSERLTLIERWNGTEWSIQKSPNPAGAKLNALSSVSCSEAKACTAVGYTNAGSLKTLAETWNGTEWSIQKTASGTEAEELAGVSCTSASACTAVGNRINSEGSTSILVERWNGTEWSTQKAAVPTGALAADLTSVSCRLATACTAAGEYTSSAKLKTALVERWSGSEWSVQTAPIPSTANTSGLNGVSCPAATECTTSGEYEEKGTGKILPFIQRLRGTEWTTQTIQTPTGSKGLHVAALSCFVTTECALAGNYVNAEGSRVSLAEKYTAWKLTVVDNSGTTLSKISCPSSALCIAVGVENSLATEFQNFASSFMRTEGAWKRLEGLYLPAPEKEGESAWGGVLRGISCTSTKACTAVGNYMFQGFGSAQEVTLADFWNGVEWLPQKTPNLGASFNRLNNVSCSASNACTAVGYYRNASAHLVPLAERWNGSTWSTQTVPAPEGTSESELRGVSCPSATSCVAVGYTYNGSSFIESWNGKEWTVQKVPSPEASLTVLQDVACGSSTNCVAVGSFHPSSGGAEATLAEVWNGSEWQLKFPANSPTGASYLEDVSCPSATWCVAVGDFVEGSSHFTMAEGWNGIEWSWQQTYNQGNGLNVFSGVSCSSGSNCVSVGIFGGTSVSNSYTE